MIPQKVLERLQVSELRDLYFSGVNFIFEAFAAGWRQHCFAYR